MSKFNVKGLAKSIRSVAVRRSPEILTGVGIAGMVTTTVLAVKATPKVVRILDNRKIEIIQDDYLDADEFGTIKLPVKEVIRLSWKCYIPAAITGALSITCLVGASSVNLKRNAALATAYKLSETALHEYRDAVVETIGEKKAQLAKDKVAEKKLAEDPVSKKEVIITGNGHTLCYDAISGRYFESDMETIKRAENTIYKEILDEECASLNEFYDEVGLSHTEIGDKLGWRIDDGRLEIDFSSSIANDGRPCLVINYSVAPKYDFYRSL